MKKASGNLWRAGLVAASLILIALCFLPFDPPKIPASVQDRNLDVYLMIDNSLSMKAGDYDDAKTRLAGLKADFIPKIDALTGSRFTLVSFHGNARVEVPGMYDASVIKTSLKSLEPVYSTAKGTAFIPALKLVQERVNRALQQERTKDMRRVLIVVSDGESIGETTDATTELAALKKNLSGALVIGVGTEKGATMKIIAYKNGGPNYDQNVEDYVIDPSGPSGTDTRPRNKDGLPLAVSKANPTKLKDFASKLGGNFMELHKNSSLESELKKLTEGTSTKANGREINARSAPNSFYWMAALLSLVLLWTAHLRIGLPKIKKVKS